MDYKKFREDWINGFESRRSNIRKICAPYVALSEPYREYITELLRMSSTANGSGADRAVFLAENNKSRVKIIGHLLNNTGGHRAMSIVAYTLEYILTEKPENVWADVSELESAWHGIGEWLK